MATDTLTQTDTPDTDTPEYPCSDCVTPTPATEVHAIGGGDVVAYCYDCAPTWRPVATMTYSVELARLMGVRPTL